MKKAFLLIAFLFSFLKSYSQKDSVIVKPIENLIERNEFTIFKNDTFNRIDNNNLIQGKGIMIFKNQTRYQGISSHVWYLDKGCRYEKEPDLIVQSINYISYGGYENNKKEGVWTVFWKSGAKKLEITYEHDEMIGSTKIYDESEQLIYQGYIKENEQIVELEKVTKTGKVIKIQKWFIDDLYALNW
jgi:hypothetical protein